MVLIGYNGVVVLATGYQNSLVNQSVRVGLPDKPVLTIKTLIRELAQSVEVDAPDVLAHRALDQLRIRAGRNCAASNSTHDQID